LCCGVLRCLVYCYSIVSSHLILSRLLTASMHCLYFRGNKNYMTRSDKTRQSQDFYFIFLVLPCLKSYDLSLIFVLFPALSWGPICSLSCLVLGANAMRTNEKRLRHTLGGTKVTRQGVTRRDNHKTSIARQDNTAQLNTTTKQNKNRKIRRQDKRR
jgi:hypothetical protein